MGNDKGTGACNGGARFVAAACLLFLCLSTSISDTQASNHTQYLYNKKQTNKELDGIT